MLRRALAGAVLSAALTISLPAHGQDIGVVQSPVLTLDTDRLFLNSAFGRRLAREVEAESVALAAENRRIEAELAAEEQKLTDQRADTEPDVFRDLANAFDEKVRRLRREQDNKARALNSGQEKEREEFLQVAAPILEELMQESGAAVVMDRRAVFLSLTAVDITDRAIERIDASIGDGTTTSD